MEFLNVLPVNPDAHISDPSSFFGFSTDVPMEMFDIPYAPGDMMGEQWASLMRETGIYDESGNFTQNSFAPNEFPF
ncbi:hypothetical protein A0H81_06211 [Grifola frondosa]|uniref:Uncharacterized protein n=1 Tax=Grifola frondosa TaxID=5627 RepID=A0A1C7MFF2_GRIFR|nr:hypothetical protein A0H81_06211 [Grifola frondosa]